MKNIIILSALMVLFSLCPSCRNSEQGIKPVGAQDSEKLETATAELPARFEAEIQQFETQDKDVNAYRIDVGAIIVDEDGYPEASIFEADSLHMNALAYERWTKLLKPFLEKL